MVYGWFMAPAGWPYALLIWAYTLVSFFVASAIKIGVYRLLDHRAATSSSSIGRSEHYLPAGDFQPLRSRNRRGRAQGPGRDFVSVRSRRHMDDRCVVSRNRDSGR